MTPNTSHELPEQVRGWIVRHIDPAARIVEAKPLYGGMSSAVYRITLESRGSEKQYVLRLFTDDEWNRNEPDLARHEAECLRLAGNVETKTPAIVAYDETGDACGKPAVLMSLLPGAVVIEPERFEPWIDGLAEALASVHRADADSFPWKYRTYIDVNAIGAQTWSSVPDRWEEARQIVLRPWPEYKPCLIHRDYHPTNVLWHDGRVSGIVDWVNACSGPAGIDVGHCRLNLAQMYGAEAADRFLNAYERYAGDSFRYDPYWDLLALMDILFDPPDVYAGWTALGMQGLTERLVRARLDEYVVRVLAGRQEA